MNGLIEAEVVVSETNSVAVRDEDKAALLAVLKPIAERIEVYQEQARKTEVVTALDAEQAGRLMESMKADSKTVAQFLETTTSKLHKLHRRWTQFRDMFCTPLDESVSTLRRKVVAWQAEEQRKANALQAKLQAEADEKARKERERLEAKADKVKSPEKQEEYRAAAAQVLTPTVTVAAQKFVSTRKVWKVKAIDQAVFLAGCSNNPDLRGYIDIKTSAMERSKAANKLLRIPGVEFEERTM